MFTGIIQNRSEITQAEKLADGICFWINYSSEWPSLSLGDSLAVNGVCLTIEEQKDSKVRVTAIKETLDKTYLGTLVKGDVVNLETAATMSTALGGHMVSGHVDSICFVKEIILKGTGQEVWLEIPKELQNYTIAKGSICFDGISLTIAEKNENKIKVALIPETLERTSAGSWKVGDEVHIEADQMAKYFENFLQAWKGEI